MPQRFTLTSPGLEGRQQLAMEHTCDGGGSPPLLEWSHAPRETRSFALIMEEIDSDGHAVKVHWAVWDIPPDQSTLDPVQVEQRGTTGRNSFSDIGCRPPCPARDGRHHRYRFSLHALSADHLELDAGATTDELGAAIERCRVASTSLTAMYARGPVVRP